MTEQELINISKKEIELNKQDEKLWKKSLVLTNKDIPKAKEKYIRQRIIQLKKMNESDLGTLHKSLSANSREKINKKPPNSEKKVNVTKNDTTRTNPETKSKGGKFFKYTFVIALFIIAFFVIENLNKPTNKSGKYKTTYQETSNKNSERWKYSLTILPSPENASVKILNIKPKYYDGIRLSEGKYHIQVSKSGYQTKDFWMNLNRNHEKYVDLIKKILKYSEKKPLVGTKVLNKNELLYCEAEIIRLDIVENKIDKYSQSEINKYNNLSDDYNLRCKTQYYIKDMKSVKDLISKNRYKIEQEGLKRFFKDEKQKVNKLYSLSINAIPSSSKIVILNIKPKYYDGMPLKKGKYHIQVSKSGYKTKKFWMNLDRNHEKNVELIKKIAKYSEKKPLLGTKVLNKNELLYCEAEMIRLDIVKEKVDKYSESEINKYNKLFDDYDSRCVAKYYKKDMISVKELISKNRSKIEQEGLNKFFIEKKQKVSKVYSLSIKATPSNSKVTILNIKPKYYDGIRLKKGKYHIQVSKAGYKTIKRWIDLEKDEWLNANLTKNEASSSSKTVSGDWQDKRNQCLKEGKSWRFNSYGGIDCGGSKKTYISQSTSGDWQDKRNQCLKQGRSWRFNSNGGIDCF